MGPVIIHCGKNLKNKEKFMDSLKELVKEKSGIFPEYIDVIIYESTDRISFNKTEEDFIFCELFSYEGGDNTEKKYFLHRIFGLINEICGIKLDDISGVIHQVKKEQCLSPEDHNLVEDMLNKILNKI